MGTHRPASMKTLSAALLLCLCGSCTAVRLIRFMDDVTGSIHTGVPIKSDQGLLAKVVHGDVFGSLRPTGEVKRVQTLLAPVPQPPVILGIGLNYWGHINATHLPPPKTPSVFSKFRHSYNHPLHPIVIPPQSSKPDYEGELAIVFSKDCKDVTEEDALSCVLGYTVCNDVSARCFQSDAKGDGCPGNGGQFSFSKGFDTHAPLGPALLTTDELGDASDLTLTTRVNGKIRQNVSTSELIYGVKKIVAFVTTGTTVDAGTVICSGTPDGVGDTMKPPVYLNDGDHIDITISQIGTLSNHVIRHNSTSAYKAAMSTQERFKPASADLNKLLW